MDMLSSSTLVNEEYKEDDKLNIMHELQHNSTRKALITHNLLIQMRSQLLSFDQLVVVLSQWYHPLHYFPKFLGKLIAVLPNLEMQTAISKILWQELGEGQPERAHEFIYEKTMEEAGFQRSLYIDTDALPQTKQLIMGYKQATEKNYLNSLGYIFGTEAADLAMVSAIGSAVSRCSGKKNLEWVNIHIQQETDHTDSVDTALTSNLSNH